MNDARGNLVAAVCGVRCPPTERREDDERDGRSGDRRARDRVADRLAAQSPALVLAGCPISASGSANSAVPPPAGWTLNLMLLARRST